MRFQLAKVLAAVSINARSRSLVKLLPLEQLQPFPFGRSRLGATDYADRDDKPRISPITTLNQGNSSA